MRIEKLKTKSIEELIKEADEKKIKLYAYKLDLKSGKEKDTGKVKFLKKDIARILTIISTKRLAGEAVPQVKSEEPKIKTEVKEEDSLKEEKVKKETKVKKASKVVKAEK